MDKLKIVKMIGIGLAGGVASGATDALAPRADGMNPNHIRLIAVAGAACAMQYAEAAIERLVNRKLG